MKMPMAFIGHGSPMNIIENNDYTKNWEDIAKQIPRPSSILMISAHWYTKATKLMTNPQPETIYDFYGFPEELYHIKYNAKGAVELADRINQITIENTYSDPQYGLDHGAWSVLKFMYPDADIPVTQLSVDASLSPDDIFKLGLELSSLRNQGVLILGSGNVVHNLRLVDFSIEGGYDWAYEFDHYIKHHTMDHKFNKVVNYKDAGSCSNYAFTTPDHFYPLLYLLGAADNHDKITVYNDSCLYGSLSMTSYLFMPEEK